jgi:hypothetical protein
LGLSGALVAFAPDRSSPRSPESRAEQIAERRVASSYATSSVAPALVAPMRLDDAAAGADAPSPPSSSLAPERLANAFPAGARAATSPWVVPPAMAEAAASPIAAAIRPAVPSAEPAGSAETIRGATGPETEIGAATESLPPALLPSATPLPDLPKSPPDGDVASAAAEPEPTVALAESAAGADTSGRTLPMQVSTESPRPPTEVDAGPARLTIAALTRNAEGQPVPPAAGPADPDPLEPDASARQPGPTAPEPPTTAPAAPERATRTLAATTDPGAVATGPVLVQFTATTSEGAARSEWARLQRRVPELAGHRPVIERFDRAGRPPLWRLRASLKDHRTARALCAAVAAKGADCVTVGGLPRGETAG